MSDDLSKSLMWSLYVLAVMFGLLTVAGLIVLVVDFRGNVLLATILSAVGTAAAAEAASKQNKEPSELSRYDAEQKMLTKEQRRRLKQARGGLLFDKGMAEVEYEQDQLTRRQIERAKKDDDDR